jgi:hypothetical protein
MPLLTRGQVARAAAGGAPRQILLQTLDRQYLVYGPGIDPASGAVVPPRDSFLRLRLKSGKLRIQCVVDKVGVTVLGTARCAKTLGMFLDYLARVLVFAHAEKRGVPEMPVRRPLTNSDLYHELRLEPAAVLHCFTCERKTATCVGWFG